MNAKIEVRHTAIVVNNYTWGDCTKLENYFRIYNRTTHTVKYVGLYYDDENKKLYLPRGMDIYLVERLLSERAVLTGRPDPYDHIDVKIKYLPRDDVQKEALRFMLGEREYSKNKTKSQLSVNLNMGAGKTYASIAAIAYYGIKAIIITSQTGWLEQWKNRIVEYTDIDPKEVLLISGSATINKLRKQGSDQYKIFLCSYATIKSYSNANGWESIGEMFRNIKVGIKVYDEAHLNFESLSMIDYFTNTMLTYYVTGTPARSNDEENRIYSYYFKNVPGIDLFDPENDPRTKYLAMSYNTHPSAMQISECKNAYGMDRNGYINYVTDRPMFHNMMHVLVDICLKTKGKVLIYIGTNAAIVKVRNWIVENYPELENHIGIYTSIITENKKAQLDKKIILSTTKSCGAAVDIKGLAMTIVLAEPFKSEVLARQTLGRTRDRNTTYIECVDEGFSQIKRYYHQKKPVFDKYATECMHMRLNDNDLKSRAEELKRARESLIRPVSFKNEIGPTMEIKGED